MRTEGTRVITKRQARAHLVTDSAGSSPSMPLHARPQTSCNETRIQSVCHHMPHRDVPIIPRLRVPHWSLGARATRGHETTFISWRPTRRRRRQRRRRRTPPAPTMEIESPSRAHDAAETRARARRRRRRPWCARTQWRSTGSCRAN